MDTLYIGWRYEKETFVTRKKQKRRTDTDVEICPFVSESGNYYSLTSFTSATLLWNSGQGLKAGI